MFICLYIYIYIYIHTYIQLFTDISLWGGRRKTRKSQPQVATLRTKTYKRRDIRNNNRVTSKKTQEIDTEITKLQRKEINS